MPIWSVLYPTFRPPVQFSFSQPLLVPLLFLSLGQRVGYVIVTSPGANVIPDQSDIWSRALYLTDTGFAILFLFEFVAKLFALGFKQWKTKRW